MKRYLGRMLGALFALSCAAAPKAREREGMRTDDHAKLTMLTESNGDGRPLVLVGGGLTGWLSWKPHEERLRQSRRVVRAQPLNVQLGLERRALPEGYSIKLEGAALGAALETLGLDSPVDLVAWSYGALFTLDYALDHPERVRTLTLIEPPAVWVLEATEMLDEQSQREMDALADLHRGMRGDVTEAQLASFARQAGFCPPGTDPRELPGWPVWVEHRRSLLQGLAVFAHRDEAARLRSFERPVLLVKGTGSSHFLHRIIEALGRSFPRAQTIELPGGHAPQLGAMDDFLTRLEAFQEAH